MAIKTWTLALGLLETMTTHSGAFQECFAYIFHALSRILYVLFDFVFGFQASVL
jgi:hypothetical protein